MLKTEVKLVGVTFTNPDKTSRQKILGTVYDFYWTEAQEEDIVITLRREPNNKYDSNAVAVHVKAHNDETEQWAEGQIGYVPAAQSEFISQALEDGRVARVEFSDMACYGRSAKISAKLKIHIRREASPEETADDGDIANDYFVEDDDGNVYEMVE